MITLVLKARTREPISTKEAAKMREEKYICPWCGIDLYIHRSSKGNYFGYAFQGRRHLPNCEVDSLPYPNKNIDTDLIDIDMIHKAMMTPPKKGKGGGGGGPRGPKTDNEKPVGLESLKDYYSLGLCELPNFKINKKHYLCDILLNKSTMRTVMRGNTSIGMRAVMVKPDGADINTLTIGFCGVATLSQGENKVKLSKVFELKYHDRNAFVAHANKIFNVVSTKPYRKWGAPKCDWVLVYGVWEGLNIEECIDSCNKRKCDGKWKCTGYQHAECVVPQHQIYCPPKYKKK